MNNDIFKGKTLMITGGTGSFGNTVLNSLLASDIGEIRIFSRDERHSVCEECNAWSRLYFSCGCS